ncbi:MAG: hypothetical protein AAF411_04300 [Myxococcota bacterium]
MRTRWYRTFLFMQIHVWPCTTVRFAALIALIAGVGMSFGVAVQAQS